MLRTGAALFTVAFGFVISEATILVTFGPIVAIIATVVLFVAVLWRIDERDDWFFWLLVCLYLLISLAACVVWTIVIIGVSYWIFGLIVLWHVMVGLSARYLETAADKEE